MFSTGFTYGLGNINRSKLGTGIGRIGFNPSPPKIWRSYYRTYRTNVTTHFGKPSKRKQVNEKVPLLG